MMKSITAATIGLVVGLFFLPLAAQGLHDCSTTCTQTSCKTDCNEADLRSAVSIINTCGGNRTLQFNAGYGCTISMAQTSATAACVGDPEANAVCLTGSNIVIDGQNLVTFDYSGTGLCASDPQPGPQPALFTLKGNSNTVKNFTMKYFPEGIHLRTGSSHRVEGVMNHFICEDAVTIDSTAGTNHVITGNNLKGETAPEAGRQCYNNVGSPANCGLDKAIQINNCGSCTSTISSNTIDTMGQPVNMSGGTHTITGNLSTGAPTNCGTGNCDDFCQGYVVQGGMGIFTNNTFQLCKFPIRVVNAGMVEANNNTLKDNYVAAFRVSGTGLGKLKGAGNRCKNNGFFTQSDVQRGCLVDRDNASARIDFGGGDFSGAAVIGGLSAGGNIFCQASLNDIYNSIGGSIGARNNCFDSLPPVVVGGNVNTSGATVCSAAQCNF